MKNKKALKISIAVFVIIACISFYIVMNKGHIGSYALVNIETSGESEEEVLSSLSLEFDKKVLSAKDKKEKAVATVTSGGEVVTEGVEFESSDTSVAKVDDEGKVTPVSAGKAKITAKYDGMEVTEEIKIVIPIKTMKFTTTNSTIRVGKDLQMKLQVTPSDASVSTLEYTSSDEKIAVVDSSGIVTGVAPGKVTITVYDTYTETEKEVNLTIKK